MTLLLFFKPLLRIIIWGQKIRSKIRFFLSYFLNIGQFVKVEIFEFCLSNLNLFLTLRQLLQFIIWLVLIRYYEPYKVGSHSMIPLCESINEIQ